MRWIPDNKLCELYVVKIWEGMVQNSLSCDTILKRWEFVLFCVPFPLYMIFNIVYLKIFPQKCEMCDMYICVRGMCGKNLIRRDLIGTEILTTLSQPVKNSILENEPIRKFCCVMCAVGATMASKPQNFIG